MPLLIGLDFGTEAVRAVLVDADHGELMATSARSYANGVIDVVLPGEGLTLGEGWALQNPTDWLLGLVEVVREVVHHSGSSPDEIVGLGIDFTSCTMLPVDISGQPLSTDPKWAGEPHAWPKLWKHHAAQPQADRINTAAAEGDESWLARYGGKISSEWMMPKALEILENAPDVYHAADRLVEAADWVVWQLTGTGIRNSCSAGYKAQWHRKEGFPERKFLESLDPDLGDLFETKLRGPVVPPGRKVGPLTDHWAGHLGLPKSTVVASPIIDAHAAAIGGGSARPSDLFMIMGTSTCHLLLADAEIPVQGVSGVVEGGIVDGLFGYEAGQASSGDCFAWFTANAVPDEYGLLARGARTIHDVLSEKAADLDPGENGLLALDWFNGNRSVLADADLSGAIIGITLSTRPEEIYRALIEATAFGTRKIIDTFEDAGLPINTIRAGGSLAKNDLLMKIYSDVLQRDILVVEAPEVSARGAAILAGVAAGRFETAGEGAERIGTRFARTFSPDRAHAEVYEKLYSEYEKLHDYFGRGDNPVMKVLKETRRK
ncbi:MAG: ribulokinase [Rhodothermia bacterium]